MNKCFLLIVFVQLCSLTEKAESRHIFIAAHGGNGSCKNSPLMQPIALKFLPIVEKIRSKGIQVSYLISCYHTFSYKPDYVLSRSGKVMSGTNSELIADLEAAYISSGSEELFVLGHSYGGWLALQVAASLTSRIPISGLATIDPISQENCAISDMIARVKMEYSDETPLPGCQEAPSDISPANYTNIKRRTGTWRNYFQNATPSLRSGPIRQASSNHLLFTDQIIDKSAHGQIVLHPIIWQRLSDEILRDESELLAKDERILDEAEIKDWSDDQDFIFTNKPIADYAARIRLLYQKYTVAFYPKSASKKVIVFQPNSEPALGLSFQIGRDLTFNYAHSINLKAKRSHRSTINHYFGEKVTQHYMVRFRYQDYKGFYAREIDKNDRTILNDGLFRNDDDIQRPSMKLQSLGVSGYYVFDPNSFSLPVHVTQMERSKGSGFSLLVGTEISGTRFSDRNAILSQNQKDSINADENFDQMNLWTVSAFPGLGLGAAYKHWYFGSILAWGYSVRRSYFQPNSRSKTSFVPYGYIDGSAAYLGKNWFSGLRAYKSISAESRGSFGIATSYSSAEMYLGRYF